MEWPWDGEAATLDQAADYPLHDACERGDVALVVHLCESGHAGLVEVDLQRNWTPIQYAAANGHTAVCARLLSARAQACTLQTSCEPLELALHSDSWPTITLFLRILRKREQLVQAARHMFVSSSSSSSSSSAAIAPDDQPASSAPVPPPPVRRGVKSGPAAVASSSSSSEQPSRAHAAGVIVGAGYVMTGSLAHAAVLPTAVREHRGCARSRPRTWGHTAACVPPPLLQPPSVLLPSIAQRRSRDRHARVPRHPCVR